MVQGSVTDEQVLANQKDTLTCFCVKLSVIVRFVCSNIVPFEQVKFSVTSPFKPDVKGDQVAETPNAGTVIVATDMETFEFGLVAVV